jgi:hypothetical protein
MRQARRWTNPRFPGLKKRSFTETMRNLSKEGQSFRKEIIKCQNQKPQTSNAITAKK